MSNDEASRAGAKTQSGNAPADRVWALSIGHSLVIGHWKLVIFLTALVVGLGIYLWYRPRLPEPPAPNLQEIDPAIVAAVEEAREAVLRSPRSASAWGHLGKVLAAHEFATEGDICFRQAERLDPRQPRWPYYQGHALSQGKPEEAITKFQRAVALCDAEPDAPRLRLAELLLAQGRLEEAAHQFRRLLQIDPNHAKAHLGMARLAYLDGDSEDALRHLTYSRSDARTRRDSLVLTVEINQRRGHTAADERSRRSTNDWPKDAPWPDPFMDEVSELRVGKQTRLDRAARRLGQGQVEEAITLLEETLRDYPESDWGWFLLGKALNQRRDWLRAERALKKAAHLTPSSPEIQFHLGVAFYQRQNREAAVACFRKAIELKPDYAVAHYDLGLCFRDDGDSASAMEAFHTAIRCQPDLAEAHMALGELLAKKGRHREALRHLQQAREANPRDAKVKWLFEQQFYQFLGSLPW